MLFMVIERFRDRDPIPGYRRVRDSGIKFPERLKYVGSWIEPNFDRCFQLMECDDARLLQEGILNCHGLGMTFEIVPVGPRSWIRNRLRRSRRGIARDAIRRTERKSPTAARERGDICVRRIAPAGGPSFWALARSPVARCRQCTPPGPDCLGRKWIPPLHRTNRRRDKQRLISSWPHLAAFDDELD